MYLTKAPTFMSPLVSCHGKLEWLRIGEVQLYKDIVTCTKYNTKYPYQMGKSIISKKLSFLSF